MNTEELVDRSSKYSLPSIEKHTSKEKKRRFRVLTGLALSLIIVVILVGAISAYSDEVLTHPMRIPITSNPADYGLSYQNVSFLSRVDHIRLSGWFIPAFSPSNRTIIFAHGHATNRMQSDANLMSMFSVLVKHGYNVFTFDFRDSGESDGTIDTVGYLEQRDLEGAFDYIKSRPQDEGQHIGLLGFSMGAAVSLLVAANEPRVEAVIADSSFADLQQYLDENLSKYSHLPYFPFTPVMEWLSVPLTGFDPAKVQPIKSIARIAPRPILLIHGEVDSQISVDNSRQLLAAAHNPKVQLWIVPKADHVQSYKTEPAAYFNRILTFFDDGLARK
jgi:dipeptidyl aminopeptidase/acylaminoacyl peptidase